MKIKNDTHFLLKKVKSTEFEQKKNMYLREFFIVLKILYLKKLNIKMYFQLPN